MDEKELIRAVAKKDDRAFKILVDQNQRNVINLAFKFVQNRQDAEDVAQEVFFSVWKNAKGFKGDSALSTWIHRITVNKALNFLRKHKRDKTSVPDTILDNRPAPASASPDQVFESSHNSQKLYEAIEKLPEKYRIPFVLNKLDGMSYGQIAETLKLSLPNVETRIHRAKKHLQEILLKSME